MFIGRAPVNMIDDEKIQEILLKSSQCFKDTIIDFLIDISAGFDQEQNNYDKLVVDFLEKHLRKMTVTLQNGE